MFLGVSSFFARIFDTNPGVDTPFIFYFFFPQFRLGFSPTQMCAVHISGHRGEDCGGGGGCTMNEAAPRETPCDDFSCFFCPEGRSEKGRECL